MRVQDVEQALRCLIGERVTERSASLIQATDRRSRKKNRSLKTSVFLFETLLCLPRHDLPALAYFQSPLLASETATGYR